MPGTSLTTITDGALPALAEALDGAAMAPRVASALGVAGAACSVEVLSHKAGSRCTLRYTVEGDRRAVAVGKVYRRRDQAELAFRLQRHLSEAFAGGPVRVPGALSCEEALGMVLQRHVEAPDVREALVEGAGAVPVAATGRWLAKLHAMGPIPGMETTPAGAELRKAGRRRAAIEAALPGVRERLQQTWRALEEMAARPSEEPSVLHRDLYYAHVLWDGSTAWIVDFDQMKVGDPALDVAHFLAHLENLSLRRTERPEAYAGEGRAFVDAYGGEGGRDVAERLPLYRSMTLLKLAATEAARGRSGWRSRAEALTALACEAAGA